ncbi:MAG TPA: acyltransferase domain-containing protein [Thermoanaerobaculia bacterium]|nr:acyltransferase domain-containing protein [Thermoanaerobaculia bacterium]
MFSGQGSQYFHMGKALYDGNDTFRDWMTRLDEIARQSSGQSVIETLYSGAHRMGDPFDRTLLTHPAIFMVEYSLAQSLIHAGVRPVKVLGVSMGSFAAAAVAGFIDAGDALTAVIRQAIAIEEGGEPGGMIAVLADPGLFAEDFLGGRSELAAVNFSSNFVVSARQTELAEIATALKQRNVAHQRLPVSFPFHSQWIDQAKSAFGSFMTSIPCKRGTLPLACCDKTTILSDLSDDYFWNVVRHPIRFRETTARLEREGTHRYIDVGPSGTLATFLKYGLPAATESTVHSILTPFGVDQKNLAAVSASGGH